VPRSVKEWFPHKPDGTPNDDAQIPPRVKLRVKARSNDCCEACGVRVRYGGQVDHILALINGGENRETNLRFLCRTCHAGKTRSDVSEKAKTARTQASLAGFKNTRKPFYLPKPKPEPTRRNWYYDERGRLCSNYLKPVQPTTDGE
jgi:5-methylcytosine-specific restriction protein A